MKPLVLALLLFAPAIAYGTGVVSSEFVAGKPLPNIDVIDDAGRVRSTAEWSGIPTILAPMYARCPVACPLIAAALKRGVAQSSASPSAYRVVLFSFDPHDTPAGLRRFREREGIPLAWTVAAAAHPGDARRMLDAIGYRYGEAGGYFTHPNEVIALTADLKTAKALVGTTYDIDDLLAAARGGGDWIGRYGGWVLALLLLALLLSAIHLVTLFTARPRTISRGEGGGAEKSNPSASPRSPRETVPSA
jgi:cytochrome oxidase Cu insertion factor (SCO1/SenC/PrrC family)